MARTCQDVFNRAVERSTATQAGLFTGKDPEILSRINYAQQTLYTLLAQESRYFNASLSVRDSSSGVQARTVDLAAITPKPVERLLLVKLPTGIEVNRVDVTDLEAELPPRYYQMGSVLTEVGSEWGSSGVIPLSLWFVNRPVELNLAGALTQPLEVPDRFCDWLEWDLAAYIAGKDFGRSVADPQEIARCETAKTAAFQVMLQHLDHYAGAASRRFVLPVPTTDENA